MPCEVIGMRVGHKRARLDIPWVQPQVGLRQVKAALESNFYQNGTDGYRFFPAAPSQTGKRAVLAERIDHVNSGNRGEIGFVFSDDFRDAL